MCIVNVTHASLGPPESIPHTYTHTASRSVRPFLHNSRQKVPILYNGQPFPLKIAPSHWGSGRPSNTWFLGPARVHTSNDMSIGSAVFSRLTIVTDRPTNRPTDRPRYSVCKNRPHSYVRSNAMRPDNRGRVEKKMLPGIVVVRGMMAELGDVWQVTLYGLRVVTRTLGNRRQQWFANQQRLAIVRLYLAVNHTKQYQLLNTVYTIQPVVKTGCTTGLTTGCIV